jgi:hypothetical protein
MTIYTDLITSEHANRPKYAAMVEAATAGLLGASDAAASLSDAFDLDGALGAQLDVLGQWAGLSRYARVTITGVYFAFDAAGLGWDQGVWRGPFDPSEGLARMDDETYRLMIRAKIGANHWDGTLPAYQAIMAQVFAGTGTTVFATDNQDMSMSVHFAGAQPSALLTGLIKGGSFPLKPAGVRIAGYFISSVISAPFFGFDISSPAIAGWDHGAWGVSL